ncbi:phenylacetate--CoA ligase family protein [Changchengzhania lutea]|uniref:phenylacetate--CoA ligase family protein n=1 Tax=Changchengzhania lutea TaxID=2049305 RepID=UPI00115D21F0|nr:phenylacetate--CoA ligase family protein [Changchengzhania lutea]
MKFFTLSLKLNGFPLKEAKAELKAIQSLGDDNYSEFIERKKKAIVNYHLHHNPYYKNLAKLANPSDWSSLPIMTKCDLQVPLPDRLSKGYYSNSVYTNKTSGSSGHPFIFAKDKFCHALTWAVFMDRYSWFNLDLDRSKQARFYGIPLDKKGYYKERFKDVLGKRFRFSVFDLSANQMERTLEKFKTTPFDYMNGYTSAVVQLSKYLEEEGIILSTICPSLKACIVTSEMLFDDDRALLESQFGIPIVNEYGAAEVGLIAFQNKHNEWQVNSDDLFIEILDEDNNALPYGKTGRVVITSLYNKANPFIRYDLGDMGKLSTDSTLKKPILESLVGRTNDLVKLPSGKTAAGLTFYYVTKTVIEKDGNVKEFTIEQLTLNEFIISYVSLKVLSEKEKTKIKTAISEYLEPNLTVTFEQKQSLDRSNRGKLKQFKSYL